MTTWSPDVCDCVLTLDASGEPVAFVRQCTTHAGKQPAAVATHCRAKERIRAAAAQALNLLDAKGNFDLDQVSWQRGPDGGVQIILPDSVTAAKRSAIQSRIDAATSKIVTLTTVAELTAAKDG